MVLVLQKKILIPTVILLSSPISSISLCLTNKSCISGPRHVQHTMPSSGVVSRDQSKKQDWNGSKLNVLNRQVEPNLLSFQIRNSMETALKALRSIKSTGYATLQGTRLALRQSWWCFPMLVILFPIICIMNGSCAQMPSWWAMSNLNHLHSSKIGHLICTGFLFSNIFYFISGLHLLNVNPLQRNGSFCLDSHGSKVGSGVTNNRGSDPILGWLVLSSGVISLLYHTFQTFGALNIAESLCFVDHGLALSSGCCFFDKCGMPSLKTWIIGMISLCLLAIEGDVYPIVHSLWHLGSAGVTISWACDGVERRSKFISESLQQKRLKML